MAKGKDPSRLSKAKVIFVSSFKWGWGGYDMKVKSWDEENENDILLWHHFLDHGSNAYIYIQTPTLILCNCYAWSILKNHLKFDRYVLNLTFVLRIIIISHNYGQQLFWWPFFCMTSPRHMLVHRACVTDMALYSGPVRAFSLAHDDVNCQRDVKPNQLLHDSLVGHYVIKKHIENVCFSWTTSSMMNKCPFTIVSTSFKKSFASLSLFPQIQFVGLCAPTRTKGAEREHLCADRWRKWKESAFKRQGRFQWRAQINENPKFHGENMY